MEERPCVRIAPSILSADFAALASDCRRMADAGADLLHLDVMDGNFVPNITFGPVVIRALRAACDLPFDVHLMITHPARYIDDYVAAGADSLTIHLESDDDVGETLAQIRAHGVGAALSLRPATPPERVFPYLAHVDRVLVMTVEPGFGGQAFQPEMLAKIERIRDEAMRVHPTCDIQVDGGISAVTAPLVARAGARTLVAGSALFGAADYRVAVDELRRAAYAGLAG